jgi:hypothetical protein
MRLHDLATARAGDKGNISDISVFAKSADMYAPLCAWLSAARVKAYFVDLGVTQVERFEVPQLLALKFVLHDALHGGVSRSLALDLHGKALSSILLQMQIPPTFGNRTNSKEDSHD